LINHLLKALAENSTLISSKLRPGPPSWRRWILQGYEQKTEVEKTNPLFSRIAAVDYPTTKSVLAHSISTMKRPVFALA